MTLGWGAETKAGQMLATSTMATFGKAGVSIASKQVNNRLLQGALRLSGQGVKLLGPAINEGTKMFAYTAVTGTATNIANRTIKFDSEENSLDKFLQTEAMVLDNAKGSFGFGAFAGVFGSTVTQKVMQRASRVSQKVGTALSDKFAKGAVDANEVFTTILEKSAPTKIAEVAAFVTDVLGFTAFESVLAIINNLDNYPDGYSVEDLTKIIWEELKSQGYNLGQIKIVAWLMSSRSARMQATRYMKDCMPQLKGATVEEVNSGKDGYKINLPDGRKIECKNTTEYISALHLMVRCETAFSSKFDAKPKTRIETIKTEDVAETTKPEEVVAPVVEKTAYTKERAKFMSSRSAREATDSNGNKIIAFHLGANIGDYTCRIYDKEGHFVEEKKVSPKNFESEFGIKVEDFTRLKRDGILQMSIDFGIVESLIRTIQLNYDHSKMEKAKSPEEKLAVAYGIDINDKEYMATIKDIIQDIDFSDCKTQEEKLDLIHKEISSHIRHFGTMSRGALRNYIETLEDAEGNPLFNDKSKKTIMLAYSNNPSITTEILNYRTEDGQRRFGEYEIEEINMTAELHKKAPKWVEELLSEKNPDGSFRFNTLHQINIAISEYLRNPDFVERLIMSKEPHNEYTFHNFEKVPELLEYKKKYPELIERFLSEKQPNDSHRFHHIEGIIEAIKCYEKFPELTKELLDMKIVSKNKELNGSYRFGGGEFKDIRELYEKEPELTRRLLDMKDKDGNWRFDTMWLEELINCHKQEPELTDRLLNMRNSNGYYKYGAMQIIGLFKFGYKQNPELVRKIVDLTEQHDVNLGIQIKKLFKDLNLVENKDGFFEILTKFPNLIRDVEKSTCSLENPINPEMRDYILSGKYAEDLKQHSAGKYQKEFLEMLSPEKLSPDALFQLVNTGISIEDFLESAAKMSKSTYKLMWERPNQYLSNIDPKYTTPVDGKLPELPPEEMVQARKQVNKFFQDNIGFLTKMLKYVDTDTVSHLLDKRTALFQADLLQFSGLTDENCQLVSDLLKLKSATSNKNLSPREKMEVIKIVEIFQDGELDVNILQSSVSSGTIDINSLKQLIHTKVLKKAGVGDELQDSPRAKFNTQYSYLAITSGNSSENIETTWVQVCKQTKNMWQFKLQKARTNPEVLKQLIEDQKNNVNNPFFNQYPPRLQELEKRFLDMLENFDKYKDSDFMEFIDQELEFLRNGNVKSAELYNVIKIATEHDFNEYINDPSNRYGKVNEETKAQFESQGLHYDKWQNPEIPEVELEVAGKKMKIRLWGRIPQEDLFMGNKTTCCTAIGREDGNGGNGAATPVYLLNTAFQVVELFDERGNVVGMSRVYMVNVDGKPALAMDNIELNKTYIKGMTDAQKTEIRNGFFKYMNQYVEQVTGDKDAPVYFWKGDIHVPNEDLKTVGKITKFVGKVSQDNLYINASGCRWIDPHKMEEIGEIEWLEVPKEKLNPTDDNTGLRAKTEKPSFSLIEDNTVLTEKEIDTRLRDFGFNDTEISEIKTNIKNIDIIIKMFSFGKKLGIDLSDKKLLLESFYSYDQSPDLPKKSYFTEENYNKLKKYVDVSELKPEEALMLIGFLAPDSFESIKKYTDLVGHKLSLDELDVCLKCTDKNGILYENALKLSKYPLAIDDCKDKDGNFDDSMIDFTYELLEANSSENLKHVPNVIIKLCIDKNGRFIKEKGDLISKYSQAMGIKLVSDGIQLANGKINEQILNTLLLKKDKHIGFIHIERSLKEHTDKGEYLVNPDAVELYFKWLDLGTNDWLDFEMLSRACKNKKGNFDKHSLEFAGKLIDITTKRLEADNNPNAERCNSHIEKIIKLINSGEGELNKTISKAVLDAIPKVPEFICTEGMLNSVVDALDACISENGFSKGAFEKTMAIIFDDMYALDHLKHKENGGSKDVICEKAIDLYNTLAEHDCLSSLFNFVNFKKSNGEFDIAKLEAAIQLVDMIKPNEVGELSGFAAACVEDGKVNTEKIKTIKFIKTAKLSDLRNFVQKYADEYGYVDIFKLMPVVKRLGFGIDFANYIKIACYEPECVKYAEILKDNGYGYSEIGQLIDSIRQCVTNANPKTILTESDYVHLTKLASLRIKSDKLNTILYRCMNRFNSETLFSSEKLKTASDLIAEYPVLEDTFSNNAGRAHDTDIIMPVKTIVEKLKEQNVDKSIQNNIFKAITNENIEFALEHIGSGAIPLEHLGNMLEVINIKNRDWNFIKKHIQDKDVPWEYLPQLIKKIRVTASWADPKYYDKEPSIIVAEDLIKNQRFSWEEKIDIQECVNGSNAALVKELSNNPDFPASVIKRILMAIDSNNYDMAEQLCKNYKKTEVPVETIPTLIENAEKISYKDVQKLIRKIGKAKASKLTNNELVIAAQFVDVMGKTDINELSIAGKRKLLRDLVASNTGVFNISENLREDFPLLPKDKESYCELLPAIVRSLGIETNILTTEQTVQFYQSQENLSAVLRDISDKDYAQLHITQEFSKDDFIEIVLSKVKDLSSEERQKVFDYFGFELHHNNKGTQGKYSITGYPVNLNNGHKLAMITDPKTRAVVENLRPDVIRFSEKNPIKCENKEVEKLLNEIAIAVPEIRTMIGKVQHGTHDFDLMKHTLKVMQKISQDPKFKQLSESDQKIMLLASLMHDISKGEGFSDHTHATEGSFDTFFIAKKFNLTKEEEIKLYTLIRHHEWLSYVNTAKTEAEQTKRLQSVAYDLQRDNLLDMAIIFTHADLRAVKADDSFHDRTDGASRRTITGTQRSFGESADVYVEKMKGLVKILQNSQPLLPVTPIPTASSMKARINKINEDGSTNIKGVYVDKDGLMLIKFNEVEDWEALGFPKGTTSKGIMSPVMEGVETGNIKWFVHGLEYPNQLAKFDAFGLVNSDALLSVSYTERPESKYRFFRTQGVVLNVATKYVHGGGETDSGSGTGKSIQDFKNRYIFGGERESDRLFVSNLIKEATGMSDAEYVEFVRKNENRSFTEIEPVEYREKIIQAFATINSKTRRGERAYNEMYASNPEVMAVFAYSPTDKVGNVMDFYSSSSERLDFLKDFALKRDIPMIVFGN